MGKQNYYDKKFVGSSAGEDEVQLPGSEIRKPVKDPEETYNASLEPGLPGLVELANHWSG